MKKTIIAGAFVVMGVFLLSCTKEMDVKAPDENTAGSGVTITATATVVETKTTYADNEGTIEVNWEATESFKAYTTNYGSGTELTFNKTGDATGKNATFKAEGDVSEGATLYAVYDPKGKFTYGNTIDLTKAYVTDVNDLKNYDIMFAEGTVSGATVNFAFTHKLSFFKVTLNRGSLTAAGNDNDLKLTLVFNNCKKVGDYTYMGCEFSGNVLTRTITLAAGDVPAANESKTIYVAMPPLEYAAAGSPVSSGLTASYSKIFSLKYGKSIGAGNVYSTTVPFAPNNLKAAFGTPGGNATMAPATYKWTASSDNLMTVFEFASGELANYHTLKFSFSNLVDGPVRMGYYVGSTFTEFGNGFYSAGEKTVDLTALGINLSTVTKIAFGGRSSAGSCDIVASDVILVGSSGDLTATFGTPGNNATYSTYTWTATNNNLMTCFEFSKGELASYKILKFKISKLTSGTMVRMGYYVGNTFTEFGEGFGSDGTKTVDLTALNIDLKTVTKISFGGRTGIGSVNIYPSDVVLTK